MTRAVIFHCEGVLIDTSTQTARAWEEMCKQWVPDVPLTEDDLQAVDGLRVADALSNLIETHFTRRELADAMKLRAEMQHHAVTEFPLQLCLGVVDLLERLRDENVAFAVTSSFVLDQLLFQLQKTNLLREFEICVGSDEVETGPPAPDVLQLAAERLGLAPRDCVTVQATPRGIETAHAAGMRVIALTSSYPENALAHAHRVVASLDEAADEVVPSRQS